MHDGQEFAVSFGRIGRTLLYEDAFGTLLFAFDVAPSIGTQKEWTLHLGKQPLATDGTMIEYANRAERERVAVALQRVKDYVSSRGYDVEMM